MDVLLRQQYSGLDPVRIVHSQHPQGTQTRTIYSLLFVNDALDIATTYAGIQDRARISNTFTGQSASGGVFGADKSFLLYLSHAHPAIALNHDHPIEWFYDPTDGLGLVHCERFSHSQRLYHFLYIANDRGSPTHDLLMESLEAYQLDSGLTDHPLAFRIPPPAADCTLLGTMLRDLANFQPALTITTQWHQPSASLPLRPNDRPIWAHLPPALSTTLISINKLHAKKVRWVGAIANDKGTMLLSLASLRTKFEWTNLTLQRFAPIWDAIPKAEPPAPPVLRQQTLQWGPHPATQPLPRPLPTPYRTSLPYLTHPLDTVTFTGDWIRSHQDPDDTTDPTLRTKRLLLAEANSLATLAHQLIPLTNYAHLIIPDSWELRDEHDRPVTGATAPWLGVVYGRRDWPKVQPENQTPAGLSSHSDSPPGTSVNGTPLPSTSTGVPSAILYTPTPENTAYNHAGRPTAARAPISLTCRNADSQLPPAPRPTHYPNTSSSLHKRSFHKAGSQTKTYTFLDMARP
ncbi:hypothetical protein DYB37_012751 [Aphanomyces astaci]|uniref:Uncharacterized protein n=1 Tax=Aphanomyces astaci TaxID=112090 RepID=A0A3R7CPS6_APHAT|nr:hypothetical protein DYB37_012751 [Aphanomyces astaci]